MSYARWERRDAVAVITMDREDRLNALGVELVEDLVEVLREAEADPEVRAAVLTGAGRAFSSGGDLADVGARVTDGEVASRLDTMRALHALILGLRDSRLPVVAAVHGAAYGAGFSTALACDLIVATRDSRFCQVFVRRNLVPDLGSQWLLPRAVGSHQAKELMLLGEEISGERAHALGIVNRLADDADAAVGTAVELAGQLAQTAPGTMAMAKSLINRSQALSLEDSMRLEQLAQSMALGAPDTLAAMRAFLEKAAT
jgi:2-(1,2-epoxy-1,2-dihydrophenyl)acetyl-CoA isomerase